jgi:hypothetical protein
MKMRIGLMIAFFLFGPFFLLAQDNFQMSYSASGDEVIEWLIPSNDGNLILAGNTNSFDESGDGLIMKIDQQGNIIWSKIYGGPGWDEIVRIISCSDSGYAAIGYTNSYGQGERDSWIFRIKEDGEVMWSYTFGTSYFDAARGIVQTQNGDLIVVGHEESFDVAFILALSPQGEILWKREYYQDIVIWFNEVYEDGTGDLYFTGAINHDGFGIHDTFILETDSTGNFIRCKCYGGHDNDSFRSLLPYQGGFLATGDTWSWQNHQLGWLAKINKDLEIEKAVIVGDNDANQYLESACLISNSIYADIKLTNGNSYIIELDSMLNLKQSWQFNPGFSSYSSHLISLEDDGIIFSGSVTDEQTLRKDIYLNKFHPGEFTTNCNTVPHSTFIMDVNVQSADLEINEITNNSVYERTIIECSDISLQPQDLCTILPINENNPSDILLYPNPAWEFAQITIKSDEVPESVVFYNQLGAKAMSLKPLKNVIDTRGLEPGVYIVELVFGENIIKKRLIII